MLQQTGSQDGVGLTAQFNAPQGVAQDSAGNVYVADTGNHTIRKITPAGVVTTVAGLAGQAGSADGAGAAARLSSPRGVAVDAAGNVFIADTGNHTIRQLSPAGVLSTVAGVAGQPGSANGSATVARFEGPRSVAVDGAGNLYVVDGLSPNTVRKITPDKNVALFVPLENLRSTFLDTTAVATDSKGDVYLAQSPSITSRNPAGLIRKFNSQGVELVYGGATSGVAVPYPVGLTVDKDGNAIVASNGVFNSTPSNFTVYRSIVKITPPGSVTTVAGVESTGVVPVGRDGTVSVARFADPVAVAPGIGGSILVVESSANSIRQIDAQATVSTLAGGTGAEYADGTPTVARFFNPTSLAATPDGTLYVADSGNRVVRKIAPDGRVSTVETTVNGALAPFPVSQSLALGGDGTLFAESGSGAFFRSISTLSPNGQRRVYSSSFSTGPIAVDAAGRVLQAFSTTVERISADGSREVIETGLTNISGMAVAASGVIYVASGDHTVRAIDAQGRVTLVAGQAGTPGYVDATGPAAHLSFPGAMTTDTAGNLYVADATTIRKITPNGQVRTVAGTPEQTRVQLGLAPASLGRVKGLAWQGGALYATVQNVVLKITLLN